MKNFMRWLVLSSSNPQKISLTVKGFLTAAVALLVVWGVDASTLSPIVEAIIKLVEGLMGIIGLIAFIIGSIRKLHTTASGTNAVINESEY